MHPLAQDNSRDDAGQRQGDRLPVDVHRHLVVVEAQDLDGRQFPDPFSDVDIGQVVQDDDRQHD